MAATGLHAEPFRKGPYLQNVSTSSVTVLWESSRPMPGTVHLIGAIPPRAIAVEADDDNMHEIVLDGLEPGRRYRYSVECDGETQAGEFATAPLPGAPFLFVVYGDTRSNASSHERVVERIRHDVPDFILGTGDMVDDGSKEKEWQIFFDIERDLLRENVLFPSLGNHDRQGRGRTADNFRTFFALPENSPDPERYYAFSYAGARFLVLDSNAYSFSLSDQTDWIEQQLQAAQLSPDIKHVFVIMHHPPYSISLHGGQRELRERWTPLFERYRVSAVFSGHDHVYSRAERSGVRYFVTGGGGAPLYPRSRNPSAIDLDATRYFERVNHYLRVHVVGELVEVVAIRVDGSIIETVTWGSPPKLRMPMAAAPISMGKAGSPGSKDGPAFHAGSSAAIPATSTGGGRFGLLGKLGALLIVAAGAVLVWTLRS